MARKPGGSHDTELTGHVDPRHRVGAVPAADVRDTLVPGLYLGTQHLQPRRRGGPYRDHRKSVLPGRSLRVDGQTRLVQGRGWTERRHRPAVGDLLRRRGPGWTVTSVRRDPRAGGRFHRSRRWLDLR